MNSFIKRTSLIALLLLIGTQCVAQENNDDGKVRSDTITANMKNFRPRLLSFAVDVYVPVPTGEKFVGKGMEGKTSFNIKSQIFFYEQAFLKVGLGETYLRVADQYVTGNYQKTRISDQYLALGYEFLPLDKVRLGLSFSILGNAEYHNEQIFGGNRANQKDTGKLNIYELYADYEVFYFMAITVNYAYRNDRTNINVPQELESTFDRAQFHNFGIGLKFYLGDNNLFH